MLRTLDDESRTLLSLCITRGELEVLSDEDLFPLILMMGKIEGRTIEKYVSSLKSTVNPMHERMSIIHSLMNVTRRLHESQFSHGDISFNNVIVSGEGSTARAVLVDMVTSTHFDQDDKITAISFPSTTYCVTAPEIIIKGSNATTKQKQNMKCDIDNDSLDPLCINNQTSGCGLSCYTSIHINPFSSDKFSVGMIALCCMLGVERHKMFDSKAIIRGLESVYNGKHGSGCNVAACIALELWAVYFILGKTSEHHVYSENTETTNRKRKLNEPEKLELNFLYVYEKLVLSTGCWPPTDRNAIKTLNAMKRSKKLQLLRRRFNRLTISQIDTIRFLLHPHPYMRKWSFF